MLEERHTDERELIGSTIQKRYRVDSLLAEGALCAVYKGEDTVLRRPIAVKSVPANHIGAYRAALSATA